MKKKSQHFLLGKTATGLIAVLLLAGTVFAWNLLDSAVYAEADTVAVETVEDVAYKVESHTDINAYRQNGNFTAPTYSGEDGSEKWLFAGWYTDKECTKSLSQSIVAPNAANGTYYAKYAKKEVLSVRCQLKADTASTSDNTILRCVSSVDSLKYKNIGLELVTPDGSVKRMRSDKVGTKIKARDEIYLSEFTYSPKAVNTESEYFFSATERISNSDFGNGYLVKPYWITQDGTCVYGVSKYVTVNQGIRNNDGMVVDNHIYIPVQMTEQPAEGATFTANEATAVYVAYDENGGYAHLALTEVPTASVTKYTIKDSSEQEVGTYIYRNKKIEYDGTNADTSWYSVYAEEGESKFVIESSADLYGLATIVNSGNNLKGKTVYVVSDIDANTDSTTYPWTRIGDDSHRFAGTFDGQMHSIKNIYMRLSGTNYAIQGFFGVADNNAVLKNFKLIGKPTIFVQNSGVVGSVVGKMYGATLDTVYSDAQITCNRNFVGGLIGQRANSSVDAIVKNCEFAGKVAGSASSADRGSGYGGILGVSNYRVIITDCLNTGSISILSATGSAGGLVGQAGGTTEDTKITINHCLNTGTITPVADSTENFGALVGNDASNGVMTIENSFAISGTKVVDGAETCEGVTTATKANLTGTKAITSIPELFKHRTDDAEQDYRWVVVTEGTPVLRSFVSENERATTMGVDTSWYVADKTEYVLKDAADLYGFALLSRETNFADKTIKLGADIAVNSGNAKEWAENAPNFGWVEIGTNTMRFNGTFAGDGHKISGLYLSASEENKGLFGATAKSATIQNLSLKNSYFVSTKDRIGSIAGRGAGILDTVYSDAIVVGNGANVGGIFGTDVDGGVKMNNCWFDGSVTNNTENASSRATGGLIGTIVNPSTITNCLNTAPVVSEKVTTNASRVGGLIGYVNHAGLSISCCVNVGSVTAGYTDSGYGFIIGSSGKTLTNKVQNTYAVSETGTRAELAKGSLSTAIDTDTTKVVTPDCATATNALTNMPALFQYEEDGVRKNYWSLTGDGAPILTSFETMAETSAMGIDISWYDDAQSKYVLNDAADLYGLALLSKGETFTGKTIELGADITVNEGLASTWGDDAPAYQWIKIGPTTSSRFNGTFNGKGHTISGLYLNSEASYSGLFGLTDTAATIKDFKLVNCYFESSNQALGSIAGHTRGSVFDTIYSDAIVVGGHQYVGGLIGQAGGSDLAYTIKVDNCWFDGSVTNTATDKQGTGGLIGAVTAPKTELIDCFNTGMVSAESYTKKDTTTNEADEEVETESVSPRVGGMIGSLGKLSDGGACIICRSLNTGKVVYSTGATTGYGSVIGRVTGLSDTEVSNNEALIIQDTYATTKSCNNTVTSKDNLAKVAVTTVEDTEIIGAGAVTMMPGLFTENGKWITIEKGIPVLNSFSKYAKVAGELSPLQLWIRNTASPRVTLSKPTLLSSGDMDATTLFRQGGYTDGHYFYQAYITQKNTGNESQNKVRILKQDLLGENAPVFSEELLLGHANDITYNEKTGQLIVCHAGGRNITFINPETLEIIDTKALGFNINNIAYNATRDCYVVGYPQVKTASNRPFGIMNSNFKQIAGPFVSNEGTWTLTGQGASCDDDYIYLLLSEGTTDKRNAIAVYNWSGEFINLIHLNIQSNADIIEPENISVVGDTVYVSVAECWGTSQNPTKKEANVYSFTIN